MCNKASTEFEIVVSNGMVRIADKYQYLPLSDGRYTVMVKSTVPAVVDTRDEVFVKVEASKLSLEDEFMKHVPKTNAEQKLKKMIEEVIQTGLKDFWRPKYDPSFNQNGTGICFEPGNKPAVGKTYKWWVTAAKEFYPKYKSRMGTRLEYVAFLAVFIKEMVASGWTVEDAWYEVCNDSKQLGHYRNSKDAKHVLECTGCREICGFCDLANTYKLLTEDNKTENFFWLVGGYYYDHSLEYSLADLYPCGSRNDNIAISVGWIVLEDFSADN